MNINRCELSGNVTRDGELRATKGGTPVLSFGLAFNDRKRDASGKWEDVPNYIDCVMYGKIAETIAQYVKKGQKLFAAGKLRYSSWTKDGAKRSKIEFVIDTIDLASGRMHGPQATRQTPAQQEPEEDYLYDEEIPF